MGTAIGVCGWQRRAMDAAFCPKTAPMRVMPVARAQPGGRPMRFRPRRKSKKQTADAGVMTEMDAAASEEEEKKSFDWWKTWWPVQLVYNLDTDRPNRIELMGQVFAVWKSKNGEWVAMRDACPHRLAPLSEGRIEDDGTLMCSYHGWRFNECGKCVKIPQADDAKAHDAACSSHRSKVKTFPCQVYGAMLWIWPDDSELNFIEAKHTPFSMSEKHAALQDKMSKEGWKRGFTRIVPYGYDVLVENIVDPAHFPFAHHDTFFGTRDMGKALHMRPTDPFFPEAIAAAEYDPHKSPKPGHLEVMTPTSILLQQGEVGEGDWAQELLFPVPIDSQRSRLFAMSTFSWSFHGNPLKQSVAKIQKHFPWLMHLGAMLVFDGDTVFLHGQDKHLRSMEKTWSPQTYYMAASSDFMVNAYRKWLRTEGRGGPLPKEPMPVLSRKELLDRYSSHTVECKICQDTLSFLRKTIRICRVSSQVCLIFVAGVLFAAIHGAIASWKAALALIPLFLFAFIENIIREKIIPQFYFVDYVHAEKN